MGRLTAIVLGAAAGGGFPQWNCRCPVCRLAWDRDPRVKPRTQASLAVSADEQHWILLNASPDLRAQIAANAVLQPRHRLRDSPIAAVILTGAEVDQIAGLLNLRERQRFALFATADSLAAIAANPIFAVLASDLVSRKEVSLGEHFALAPDLTAELFAVPGKPPLYLEGENPELAMETGVNVGVELTSGDTRVAYVPGAAAMTPKLKERLARADLVFFDGTLFTDDEMIRTGTGVKSGRRMGHMPIDGAEGSLEALADVSARRVFVHINNTNPILVADSPERRQVEAAGWEVAEDGLKIVLP
jgi:pyrroloquinoline quinone biosynthesis protein B